MADIAVVGMAVEFPGAHTLQAFWENILAGRRAFRQAPDERLPRADYFDPDPTAPYRTYQSQMAVLEGWRFDPLAYKIPPVTVEASDIAHWLGLDVAARAIADAGLDLSAIDRERAGVIVGNTLAGEISRANTLNLRMPHLRRSVKRALGSALADDLLEQMTDAVAHHFSGHMPAIAEDSLSGNMANTIAGRISGHFDLGGCSYIVDGACSSALLAVVHAVRFLEAGELDAVIVGGVDVSLDPFEIVGFAKAGALSRMDIRPYDRRADGMITGEGCGMFVLARPDFARRNGLRIRARIRGAAVSADGSGGITEPIKSGQKRALRRAYEQAGYPMSSIGLMEGHGTGTPLGDRVEVSAIQEILLEEGGNASVALGGIKANIGHCKAAAGAAGLAKVILALERRVKPPHVNAPLPNPLFAERPGILYPSVEGEAWRGTPDAPRRASVSSMGFGGANSHVTLEEAEPGGEPDPADLALLGSAQSVEVVFLTAKDRQGLVAEALRLAAIADRISRAELTDLAAACGHRPEAGPVRAALVVDSPWQLAANLRELVDRLHHAATVDAAALPQARIFAGEPVRQPRIAAMFPGQGSQSLNMGRALLRRNPRVRHLYDRVGAALRNAHLPDVAPLMHRPTHKAGPAELSAWDEALTQTTVAQPAITLASVAALETLKTWGIQPDIAFGHSLGEIGALCCAGVVDAQTAVLLAARRGRAMGELDIPDPGAMLAVFAGPEAVEPLMAAISGECINVANYNAADQTIVSGTKAAIARLKLRCEDENIACRQLPVSHAFHSDIVAPAAERFSRDLETTALEPLARRRVFSTALGRELAPSDDLKDLLSRQIRLPVLFLQTLKAVASEKPDLVVEIGPGRVLAGLALRSGVFDSDQILATSDGPEDPWLDLVTVAAAAFAKGAPVERSEVFAHRFIRPFALDRYEPLFIRNPCENAVEPFPLRLDVAAGFGGLLPPEASGEAGRRYMEQRGDFIRAMIATDFRHNGGAAVEAAAMFEAPALAADSPENAPVDALDLVMEARRWVAERTGYPVEDVDAKADLRRTLNLDSIKTGELVVHLLGLIGREGNLNLRELQNVSIEQIVANLARDEEDDASAYTRRAERWEAIFQRVLTPGEAPQPQPTSPVLVVRTGDEAFAGRCAEALLGLGIAATEVALEDLVANPEIAQDFGTFVFIIGSAHEDLFSSVSGPQSVETFSTDLFRGFRALLRAKGGDGRNLRVLCIRPRRADDASADREAGAAFLKSFQLETGATPCGWISVPAGIPQLGEIICGELAATDFCGPVRYDETGIRTVQHLSRWSPGPARRMPLGADDVVLVSGGAKGITPELALALARRSRARFVLFGASPPPPADDPDHLIAATLSRFEAAGARCLYRQCDVTDGKAVAGMIAEVGRTVGTITGFLHGAGVTEFAPLAEKTLTSFQRCIAVKDVGMLHVLRSLDLGALKLVHAISSVLGHSGMRLQTDYTFANAWLDEAVAALRRGRPHIDCLTIGYTVWSGTGLGVKTGALEGLEKLGVDAVSIEEGVRAYERLLDFRHGDETAYVHTGALTTDLQLNMFGAPPPHAFRFLERILRWAPGTELLAECTLSHETDPFLADHVFEGTPILPGVMGMEAMGEALRLLVGKDLPFALRDVRFERPVVVPKGGSAKLRIAAVRRSAGDATIELAVSPAGDGSPYFRAVAETSPAAIPAVDPLPREALGDPLPIDVDSLHPDPLFQGPLFRNIEALFVRDRERAVSMVRVPVDAAYFADRAFGLATVSPAAQDSFLQTGGVIAPRGYLPTGISRSQWSRSLEPGEAVLSEVRLAEEPADARSLSADIRVFDLDGGLIGELRGVQLVGAGGGNRHDSDLGESAAGGRPVSAESELRKRETGLGFARGALPQRRQAAVRAGLRRLGCDPAANAVAASVRGGRPHLLNSPLAVSLSHASDLTVAAVSRAGPVGIDLEVVTPRSQRIWSGLLGKHGIEAARRLSHQLAWDLDQAATAMWSLLEAVRKAATLDERFEHSLSWTSSGDRLVFEVQVSGGRATGIVRALRLRGRRYALAFSSLDCPCAEHQLPSRRFP